MDVEKLKQKIKETWHERRNLLIFEGNGGIIYPTTSSPQHSTSQKPISSVSLPTNGSDAHKIEAGTADAGHVTKIIGITIASLLALIFIALIVIWVCRRRLKNDNKRVSIQHRSQSDDPDHVYADIEPVRTHSIEMPSTSFNTVPIPIKKQKKWTSVRNVSMHIRHMLGMNSKLSTTNDSIFFNKQSESVQVTLLHPAPDFPNEDRKGKGRAACQTIQSASRPVMDSDSHLLSTSSDVLMEMRQRENVCNPLTIQTDSIPYDELIIGTTGSGAHSTDPVIPGYPSDNGANLQTGDKKSHLFFILEKKEDVLDKDCLPKVTELECIDEGHCNSISDTSHSSRPDDTCESNEEYYNCVLETIESSTGSNYVKG